MTIMDQAGMNAMGMLIIRAIQFSFLFFICYFFFVLSRPLQNFVSQIHLSPPYTPNIHHLKFLPLPCV